MEKQYINVVFTGSSVPANIQKTFDMFDELVSLKIQEGYKPWGFVSIRDFMEQDELKFNYPRIRLIQTMVKIDKGIQE